MNIKSDDDVSVNKTLEFYNKVMVIRTVFHESNKLSIIHTSFLRGMFV